MTLALFWSGLGLALLVGGAYLLVGGAAALARHFGVSSLVVGLTVVAFGTSAPELAVGVRGALAADSDLVLGNVVGSNVFNVLAILGISAVIAPLAVESRLVRREVPLMILASGLLWGLCADGGLGRLEGLLLATLLVLHTSGSLRYERRAVDSPALEAEGAQAGGAALPFDLLSIGAGLMLLTVGADGLVKGAHRVALGFGVSDLLIGLTLVAVGTSLPELATSLVASIRREQRMAIGNVVGSNLFNVLGVAGLSAVASPGGLVVSAPAVNVDIPVMTLAAIACLPVLFSGWKITRLEGLFFLACYAVYVVYLVVVASRPAASPFLDRLTLLIAGSIVVVALTACFVREKPWRSSR